MPGKSSGIVFSAQTFVLSLLYGHFLPICHSLLTCTTQPTRLEFVFVVSQFLDYPGFFMSSDFLKIYHFKRYIYVLYIWVFCVYVSLCPVCMQCLWGQKRALDWCSGTEVTDGCESPCGLQESNLGFSRVDSACFYLISYFSSHYFLNIFPLLGWNNLLSENPISVL